MPSGATVATRMRTTTLPATARASRLEPSRKLRSLKAARRGRLGPRSRSDPAHAPSGFSVKFSKTGEFKPIEGRGEAVLADLEAALGHGDRKSALPSYG